MSAGFGWGREAANEETLVPGKLIGYRRFRMDMYPRNQWRPLANLTAVAQRHIIFGAGEHTARHTLYDRFIRGEATPYDTLAHSAPEEGCQCGFYGYYTPELIDETFNDNQWTCCAVVEVWGKVILGTKGFRAEKMRILAAVPPRELYFFPQGVADAGWEDVLRTCDITGYQTLDDMLAAYPPQDVSHLIPEQVEEESEPVQLGGIRLLPSPPGSRFPKITATSGFMPAHYGGNISNVWVNAVHPVCPPLAVPVPACPYGIQGCDCGTRPPAAA